MLNISEINALALDPTSGFGISPLLNGINPTNSRTASADLRLGCWFVSLRTERYAEFDFMSSALPSEDFLTQKTYVPFGKSFVLHPRSFVLAATLEWIKTPDYLGGYVTGKSSLGRRGLVIETAPGVHPGFLGCLTLELANVGEVPLRLHPGMPICQLFLHRITSASTGRAETRFRGERQPKLGTYTPDPIALILARQRK